MLWKISQVQEPTKPKFYIRHCETSRQNIIVCSVIVRGHLRTQYFRSTQMPHETQAKIFTWFQIELSEGIYINTIDYMSVYVLIP